MAKSSKFFSHLLILIGLSCFVNTGVSMLRYRKFISQDESVESYSVPLDVKVEVLAGLLLAVVGTIIAFTSDLDNIDLLHYFQNK